VTGIHAAPADFVAAQLEAVLSDIPVDVVKTGMLFCAPIITIVAQKLREYGRRLVVVDPVMVAKGGASLMDEGAVAAFREELLPLTYLLTPNVPEAEALTGLSIGDEAGMAAAARALHAMGARNVLLKGGHLAGDESVDLFFDGRQLQRLTAPRFATANTHGTGCSTASAVAAFLARGEPLPVAVARAKEFISNAIRLARPLGHGHGPVNHFLAAQECRQR
jgi:hydroxymethylpyrimidine kinase/phosphomethylpyrimidine kinase/thiamine-phosphate diphosphorylase